MYALKGSSFFRPSSRPSSPHPIAPLATQPIVDPHADRLARPLDRLTLNTLRKPSPSLQSNQTGFVQDASYLEALGLRLSEAVTKALAQPPSTASSADVLNGKRPFPPGRGRTLGALIAAELDVSRGNVHLQRAILRSLQRPLSVLLTNLSTQLLPLLSSPAFLSPPAPTVANPNLNLTQTHALAVANFAGELLDCLDELDIESSHDARGDGLNNLRDGLVSLIGRVVNPLVAGLKNEMMPMLQALETVVPASPGSLKPVGTAKVIVTPHHSIATLQTLMPALAKALSRYTQANCCQTTLATLLISLVWRALVALSHRRSPARSRTNSVSSPYIPPSATSVLKRLGGTSSASMATPPPTPPPSRFTLLLPVSRPPTPPSVQSPTAAADARVLYDLLCTLPKPKPSNDVNRVAREAVDEAFEALGALTALLGAVDNNSGPEVREDFDLELLTDGLPALIALPVLMRWAGHGEPHMIPTLLGVSESDYRDGCLSGFGRADECGSMIAQRMMDILDLDHADDPKSRILHRFLEASASSDATN